LTAVFVLLYSWAIARGGWQFAVLNGHRGIELAIASVIVILLLFTRYYGIVVEPAVRVLTIGFFLYSSFYVLNDTIFGTLAARLFKALESCSDRQSCCEHAALGFGVCASDNPREHSNRKLLSDGIYHATAPEINARLRALNEHLGHFWNVERKRS